MDSRDVRKVDSCAIQSYVSWCVDSGPAAPCPETPGVADVPEEFPATVKSSPPSLFQPSGGPETPPLSQQPPLPPPSPPSRPPPHPHSDTTPSAETTQPVTRRHGRKRTDVRGDEDDDDEEAEVEASGRVRPLLRPEGGRRLHRGSPVICRRRAPPCGDTRGPSLSAPPPPAAAPPQGRTPQDKPCSVAANLNRLLNGAAARGDQGAGQEHQGAAARGDQGAGQEHQGAGQEHQGAGVKMRCRTDAHPRSGDKDKSSSEITNCAADLFKMTCDLEKENAHFIVVDMVLEFLEGVKWTLSLRKTERLTQKPDDASGTKDDASPLKTLSVLSNDSGFEDCGTTMRPISRGSPFKRSFKRPSSLQCPTMPFSAETLAHQLVFGFRNQWFPFQEVRRGRLSLRTSLQEMPGTVAVVTDASASLSEEIRQRTRMRGTQTWAPPRFQIIFTVHPSHRRSKVIATQHFLCAGCGTEIEPRYIKKLRYCDYFGKYFCDCCHSGSESVIPGRVLTRWDFGRHAVSDFSKQLLDSVWHQPLFNLTCLGKSLRVRELERFRDLQEQLLGIKRLLTACRLSEGVLREFEQLPAHLTQGPHLFSMDDLVRVKRGQLVPLAKAVLRLALLHVESCQLCLARGFICEFCKQKDVLFPFQSETCTQCKACGACFHSDCFRHEDCPRCLRIKSRRKLLDSQPPCL